MTFISNSQKDFARTNRLEYAPTTHMCGMALVESRSEGLGMASDGLELLLESLPPIDKGEVQILPMCWQNLVTGAVCPTDLFLGCEKDSPQRWDGG
jgi:hypothetical protein